MSPRPDEGPRPPSEVAATAPTYVPLDGRGWRHAMGLRPLDLDQWLEGGSDAPAQLARKEELLRTRYDDVVALRDGSDDACRELLTAVSQRVGLPSSPTKDRRPDHPLVAASRLTPEDFCVLQHVGGEWQLRAACVCFPSRWSLGDKIGTSLDAIHGPVPGYAESLSRATNQFFDRLGSERSFWRLNWTLLDDPELFQPGGSRPALEVDPADWQFRVERQTLRRLPESGAIVFTIRTYVRSAAEVAASVPSFAQDVLSVLTTAPPATLRYKGWTGFAARWAATHNLAVPSDAQQ